MASLPLGSWRRVRRRPVVAAAAALALVVLLAAAVLAGGGDPPPAASAPPQPAPVRSSEPRTMLDPAEPPPTPVTPHELATSSPDPRLLVPAIGIDAPVVPIPLRAGGVLDPPDVVSEVGWWEDSAEPGEDQGQTVLTGHTVHTGGGVMDDLDQLVAGDQVRVTGGDGYVDYEVTEVVTWSKDELSAQAVETFGQDRHHGRLVLVTCEDWLGPGAYASNVVVFADPVTDPTAM